MTTSITIDLDTAEGVLHGDPEAIERLRKALPESHRDAASRRRLSSFKHQGAFRW